MNTRQLAGEMKVVRRQASLAVVKYITKCYKNSVGIKRTKHAVYDLKYHLVWIPKYRKEVMGGEVSEYLKETFQRIAKEYEFSIDTMEVMNDHVHIFVEAPPRYSPAQAVQIFKSVSAREIFKRFPVLRK